MSHASIFGTNLYGWWSYTAVCDSCHLFVSGPMPDLIDVAHRHAHTCPPAIQTWPPAALNRLWAAVCEEPA